jgi:hypothetical protein
MLDKHLGNTQYHYLFSNNSFRMLYFLEFNVLSALITNPTGLMLVVETKPLTAHLYAKMGAFVTAW